MDALVDYLQASYTVTVTRSITDEGTSQVQLRPATGAAMTITATAESVQIEAGALFRLVVPDCSCDACDETAESEAGRLEDTVLATAAGGLQEQYPLGRRRWLHTRLEHIDHGGSSTTGDPDHDLDPAQLEEAARTLDRLDAGWWPAWTLRQDPNRADRRP